MLVVLRKKMFRIGRFPTERYVANLSMISPGMAVSRAAEAMGLRVKCISLSTTSMTAETRPNHLKKNSAITQCEQLDLNCEKDCWCLAGSIDNCDS